MMLFYSVRYKSSEGSKDYIELENFKSCKSVFFKILEQHLNFNLNNPDLTPSRESLDLVANFQDDFINERIAESVELIHANISAMLSDRILKEQVNAAANMSLDELIERLTPEQRRASPNLLRLLKISGEKKEDEIKEIRRTL